MNRFQTTLALLALLSAVSAWADDPIDYGKRIKPILKERCHECHGPKKQSSGLRLDRKQEALAGGDNGPAIVPGDTSRGLLLRYIQSDDPEQVMPPKGDRLTQEEIDLLKKWVADGAKWPEEAALGPAL